MFHWQSELEREEEEEEEGFELIPLTNLWHGTARHGTHPVPAAIDGSF